MFSNAAESCVEKQSTSHSMCMEIHSKWSFGEAIISEHPVFGSVLVLVFPHLTSNSDTKSSYGVATGMFCVQNNQFEIMSSPGVIYSSIREQKPLPNQRNVCTHFQWI